MLDLFEKYLSAYTYEKEGYVKDAMIYATSDGGKRIRPLILLALLNDYKIDLNKGLAAALAVEFIHSYSLVHDDLPAMDNDDYRRGKLSVHKKFGQDIAILAGDSLLTDAFAIISNDNANDNDTKIKLISLLGKHAGNNGMIYGQELDLKGENKLLSVSDINEINEFKTANLIMFAMIAAAIIANKEKDIKLLNELALNLGIAFQVQDDIFDVTKTFKDLGKYSSDEDNNKSTYVKLMGLEKSEEYLEELFNNCFNLLSDLNLSNGNLYKIINEIKLRNN